MKTAKTPMPHLTMREPCIQVGEYTTHSEHLLTSIPRLRVRRRMHLHGDRRQWQFQPGLQGLLLPVESQCEWRFVHKTMQRISWLNRAGMGSVQCEEISVAGPSGGGCHAGSADIVYDPPLILGLMELDPNPCCFRALKSRTGSMNCYQSPYQHVQEPCMYYGGRSDVG